MSELNSQSSFSSLIPQLDSTPNLQYPASTTGTGTGRFTNNLMRQLNQMIIYDPSAVNLTSGPNVLGDILNALKNTVQQKQIYMFRFFINPATIGVSGKKTSRSVLEKKGWDTLHFVGTSNDMITMQFSGTTGSMVPPKKLFEAGINDTKFSVEYQRFQQFFQFFLDYENDLRMVYDGKIYDGVLSDLKFDEKADEPFAITYSFTFSAYPDRIRNIFTVGSNILQTGLPL